MVKVSEPVQDRESEQVKLVDRLDQKVTKAGGVSITCTPVVDMFSGLLQAPNPTLLLVVERVNPVNFPLGKCAARFTDKIVGQDAGKSECCTVTLQIRALCSERKWADVRQVSDRETIYRIVFTRVCK
jgi:hypothetical protein